MIHHPYTEGLFSPEDDAQVNPAAGVNVTYTLDANIKVQITGFHLTLTTDATVSNRRVMIYGYIAGAIHYLTAASVMQAASLTRTYHFGIGLAPLDAGADAAHIFCPLPNDFFLMGGNSVRSLINNIQATDQISGTLISFKQWIRPV
jgi:hypothetical protein